MLAVGIHGQGMRVAQRRRLRDAFEHRRTLAAVFRQHDHPQAVVAGGQRLQLLGGAVGAAIDHHPHRRPLRPRCPYRVQHAGTRVVAGNQDEMGR
jgi:ABC-type antimicrobial peptide transport system ATPase subunit